MGAKESRESAVVWCSSRLDSLQIYNFNRQELYQPLPNYPSLPFEHENREYKVKKKQILSIFDLPSSFLRQSSPKLLELIICLLILTLQLKDKPMSLSRSSTSQKIFEKFTGLKER